MCAVLALSLLGLVGCSEDNGTAVDGGTTTSPETDISMSQAAKDLQKFKPKARSISCSEGTAGVECEATYKGHRVVFTGTPTEGGIAFTFSGSAPN